MESGARSEQDLRGQAVERLKKKRDFKAHVLIYLLVNAFLVVIWAVSRDGDEFFWPIFVIVGWGIGVVANAWDVMDESRSPKTRSAARPTGSEADPGGGSAPPHDADGRLSRRGDLVVNKVTGERVVALIGTGDGKGDRLASDLRVRPGGGVVGEHYHPSLTERFRIVAGRLAVNLDGERKVLEAGADVTIPPRVVHDWSNASQEEEARVLVEVRPGRRFELMVTTLFGLANDGKSNAKGLPRPAQLAVLANEFADIVRFTKPPVAVQKLLFGPLALAGRARGYRGFYPQYLEPDGHEDPDPKLLALVQ